MVSLLPGLSMVKLVVILVVSELSMVNPLVGLFVVVGLSRKELLVVTIPTADPGIDIDVVHGRICCLGESLYVVVQFRRPASHRM